MALNESTPYPNLTPPAPGTPLALLPPELRDPADAWEWHGLQPDPVPPDAPPEKAEKRRDRAVALKLGYAFIEVGLGATDQFSVPDLGARAIHAAAEVLRPLTINRHSPYAHAAGIAVDYCDAFAARAERQFPPKEVRSQLAVALSNRALTLSNKLVTDPDVSDKTRGDLCETLFFDFCVLMDDPVMFPWPVSLKEEAESAPYNHDGYLLTQQRKLPISVKSTQKGHRNYDRTAICTIYMLNTLLAQARFQPFDIGADVRYDWPDVFKIPPDAVSPFLRTVSRMLVAQSTGAQLRPGEGTFIAGVQTSMKKRVAQHLAMLARRTRTAGHDPSASPGTEA